MQGGGHAQPGIVNVTEVLAGGLLGLTLTAMREVLSRQAEQNLIIL